MSEKQITVPVSELATLEIQCACGSSAVFKVSNEIEFTTSQRASGGPAQNCPGCGGYFGLPLLNALVQFQNFQRALTDAMNANKQFRVSVRLAFRLPREA